MKKKVYLYELVFVFSSGVRRTLFFRTLSAAVSFATIALKNDLWSNLEPRFYRYDFGAYDMADQNEVEDFTEIVINSAKRLLYGQGKTAQNLERC